MEKISRIKNCGSAIWVLVFFLASCSSKPILKKEEGQFDDIRKQYDSYVKVVPTEVVEVPQPVATVSKVESKAKVKPKRPEKKVERLPKIEDSEGFSGRRPLQDPFAVGEEVVLDVKYFNTVAGQVGLFVETMKEVNQRKAYHFRMTADSSRRFSFIYSVKNVAETFVDYETLNPITMTLENNESARLIEARAFFDAKKNQASLWEKRVSEKDGEQKKELHWDIEPFSQNTISALFYLRTFTLSPGKIIQFHIANDGKNYIFKAEVLRREKIDTEVGELSTVVVRVEFKSEDQLKQDGENLIWLTDDDRKFPVKVRAKLKIGSLYAEVVRLKRD